MREKPIHNLKQSRCRAKIPAAVLLFMRLIYSALNTAGWSYPLTDRKSVRHIKTLPGCHAQALIGDAGWSSPVARQAHNLKVAGSNPAPATILSSHHTCQTE